MTEVVEYVTKREFEEYMNEIEKVISDYRAEVSYLQGRLYDLEDNVRYIE